MKATLLAVVVAGLTTALACGFGDSAGSSRSSTTSDGDIPTCEKGIARELGDFFQEAFVEFADTIALAEDQPRILVPGTTGEMREMRRRVTFADTPACGLDVRNALVTYMDSEIDRFEGYLDGTPAFNIAAEGLDAVVKFSNVFLEWTDRNNCPALPSGCPTP